MIRLTSADNKTVKLARRLLTKKGRDRLGLYPVEGPKLLSEALDRNAEISFAFFCEERAEGAASGAAFVPPQNRALAERVARVGADVFSTTERVFHSIADTETPQGVLAAVRKPACGAAELFARDGANVLVLDRIQDPGNVGSLIRTADAAGFGGVLVVGESCDPYGPKAVRAAAGALFRIPVLSVRDADEAVRLLAAAGKRAAVADARGQTSCYEADLSRDLAFVIGNEGRGPSKDFLDAASLVVRIPMPGGAESLNAAAAAAVLLFESVR
ncbi:MAG: RNA methyltransferase, partial [Clostridiales Family XIII bacterium]|nr:RNA methyltransferase [Clostridiales Family XIII bacterium]